MRHAEWPADHRHPGRRCAAVPRRASDRRSSPRRGFGPRARMYLRPCPAGVPANDRIRFGLTSGPSRLPERMVGRISVIRAVRSFRAVGCCAVQRGTSSAPCVEQVTISRICQCPRIAIAANGSSGADRASSLRHRGHPCTTGFRSARETKISPRKRIRTSPIGSPVHDNSSSSCASSTRPKPPCFRTARDPG